MQNVSELLKERDNFIDHLHTDINKYDTTINALTREKNNLENEVSHLKSLQTYPEHEALIPLGKKIYMKGRIVHTGEVYVKRNAHPEPIVMLQSAQETIKTLEKEVGLKEDDIDKSEYAKFQIEERIKILKGEDTFQTIDSDLPKEIKSDKGVAVRIGDYYEILEYDE